MVILSVGWTCVLSAFVWRVVCGWVGGVVVCDGVVCERCLWAVWVGVNCGWEGGNRQSPVPLCTCMTLLQCYVP